MTNELMPIPGLNGGAFTNVERHRFCLDSYGDLAEENMIGKAVDRIKGRMRTETSPTQTPTQSTQAPTLPPIRYIKGREKELLNNEEDGGGGSLTTKGRNNGGE